MTALKTTVLKTTAMDTRDRLREIAKQGSGDKTITRGDKGSVTGALNKKLGHDELRHLVLWWLFSDDPEPGMSSKDLTDGQWFALISWIGFYEVEGQWLWSESFHREATEVLVDALKAAYGETDMVAQSVAIGGDIVAITPDVELPSAEQVPVPLLANTRFYQNKMRKQREAAILKELGFDD